MLVRKRTGGSGDFEGVGGLLGLAALFVSCGQRESVALAGHALWLYSGRPRYWQLVPVKAHFAWFEGPLLRVVVDVSWKIATTK